MSNLMKHAITCGVILIFALIFFLDTLDMPNTAANLPQIIIGVVILFTIVMFIEAFIKQKKRDASRDEAVDKNDKTNVKRVILFAVSIGLYIFLIDVLGYFVVTPLFAIATLFYLATSKIIPVFVISISFTVGIYLVFVMFLNIPLPMGILSS